MNRTKSFEGSTYLRERDREVVYNIMYFVMEGSLKCKDGRVFGQEREVLLAISFHTYEEKPFRELIVNKIVRDSNN